MTSFFLKIQVQSIYEQFRAFLHSVEIISFTKKLKKFFLPSEKAIHLGKSAFHLTTVDRWLCCQWPTAFASAAREKKAANMRYSGCGCFRPPYPWRLQLNDQLPLSTIFFFSFIPFTFRVEKFTHASLFLPFSISFRPDRSAMAATASNLPHGPMNFLNATIPAEMDSFSSYFPLISIWLK